MLLGNQVEFGVVNGWLLWCASFYYDAQSLLSFPQTILKQAENNAYIEQLWFRGRDAESHHLELSMDSASVRSNLKFENLNL